MVTKELKDHIYGHSLLAMFPHLLQVALLRVVHDGEVFLVGVKVTELKRTVGETEPETVVGVDLKKESLIIF